MGTRRIVLVVVAFILASVILLGVLAFPMAGLLAQAQPRPYVAIVELTGVIDYERPLLGGAITPWDVRELLDTIRGDVNAKAVVLVVNSPGGTMAAFEVYELVRGLSEDRVVVVYITGYGTSGGYLIALPAREIVANPTALVGSVGAVAVIISYKGLMEKLGINVTTVKSGDLKDVGNPYRDTRESDVEVIRRIVDGVASVFAEKVREHRGDKIRDYREILRAGVYTGVEAEKLGLVDRIGTLEDAIGRARELAGLPGDTPVRWVERRASILDVMLGRVQPLRAPILVERNPTSVEVLLMWPLPVEIAEKALVVSSTSR